MQNSLRTSGFAVAALLAALVVPRLAAADEIRAHLIGYNEVPSINTDGNATFKIKLSKDRSSFDWELSYAGLGADVTQAHIHFGQPAVNGAIVIWLCGNPSDTVKPPKGTQGCPNGINRSATIFGTATANDVVSVPAQGITANAAGFEAILDAIQAGVAYANVHTTAHAGGEIRGPLKHH